MATRVRVHAGTEIRAVKIRKDGTEIDLGVVSAEYQQLHMRLWWRLIGRRQAEARIRAENRHSPPLKEG